MRHTVLLLPLLATPLLLAGCYSNTAAGAATGAQWGTTIGSAVGAITRGGSQGYGWGTLIGMAGGAAAGAAVGAAIDHKQQRAQTDVAGDDIYTAQPAAASQPVATRAAGLPTSDATLTSPQPVEVSDLTWDDDGDLTLSAGETARLVFLVRNVSAQTLTQVSPTVMVDGTRQVAISDPIAIDRLDAGVAVRYTAVVRGLKRLKNGRATFRIGITAAGRTVADPAELSVLTAR